MCTFSTSDMMLSLLLGLPSFDIMWSSLEDFAPALGRVEELGVT